MIDTQDIALKIQAGNERAFEKVFKSHYAGMCGFANKYLADLEQSEEIVQEVFFNYWSKRSALEIQGSLEGYLYRSVRNACLNHIKHLQVRHQYALAQMQPLKDEENKHHDKIVELELQQKIDDCINQLPPERQKIFKLSRLEGLKYQEIANELKLSVKTVEAQMGKALKFLRQNLAEYLPVILLITLTIYYTINFL